MTKRKAEKGSAAELFSFTRADLEAAFRKWIIEERLGRTAGNEYAASLSADDRARFSANSLIALLEG